jgi:hypothetical protein
MEDLIINSSTMKLEVDIMDIPTSCVIVICDGKAKLRELPTHQGKVKRIRREEGEEF